MLEKKDGTIVRGASYLRFGLVWGAGGGRKWENKKSELHDEWGWGLIMDRRKQCMEEDTSGLIPVKWNK
jgi:hypothetical protein